MKQFDENRFKEALSQAPWDRVFVFDEIDDMDSRKSIFNSVLDENCPWREKRVKRAVHAPWTTSSVVKQLHLRDNCLKTARRSNNTDNWSNYRAARNEAVAMIRSAKRKFFCNAFEENRSNSTGIWKTVRTMTGSGKNRRDMNSINKPVLFGGQTPACLFGWLRLRHGAYETWGSSGQYTRPLIFTVFINDLPLHVSSSEIDLNADDVTITSSADCGSIGRLQESLDTFVSEVFNWALANRLPLSEKKTKVLTVKGKRLSTQINNNLKITCNGSLLTNVMNVKLLGLETDEELTFSEHITTVCKKVTQRIGLLKKITNHLPLKQRLLYYNALIRPVINYTSVLRTNCDKESLERVLKLQKRPARVILNAPPSSTINSLV